MAEKWIQEATEKNPGALRKKLGAKPGKNISAKKLAKAAKSKNPTLAKEARLAETLKKMKKEMIPEFPHNLPPLSEITRLFVEDYPMADDLTYREPNEDRDAHESLLKDHVARLMEHFDTVMIFVTRRNDGSTTTAWEGDGNWFARYGQISLWVRAEEANQAKIQNDEYD